MSTFDSRKAARPGFNQPGASTAKRIPVSLSAQDVESLAYLAEHFGLSQADILRNALHDLYCEVRFPETSLLQVRHWRRYALEEKDRRHLDQASTATPR